MKCHAAARSRRKVVTAHSARTTGIDILESDRNSHDLPQVLLYLNDDFTGGETSFALSGSVQGMHSMKEVRTCIGGSSGDGDGRGDLRMPRR